MRTREAVLPDAEQIHALISAYSTDGTLLPRTLAEICENVRDFVVLEQNGKIIGCGALHLYGVHLAEIRSITVDPKQQGGGGGRRLVKALLAQAEKDKAEGEAQMKEMEAKMAGLEGELAGILAKAETDAEAEKQRVLEAARAEATQILAQAQAEIGFQKRQAELELRALVAELAVEGAAKRLESRMQGPDAAKALDRAIQQIGQQTGGVQ